MKGVRDKLLFGVLLTWLVLLNHVSNPASDMNTTETTAVSTTTLTKATTTTPQAITVSISKISDQPLTGKAVAAPSTTLTATTTLRAIKASTSSTTVPQTTTTTKPECQTQSDCRAPFSGASICSDNNLVIVNYRYACVNGRCVQRASTQILDTCNSARHEVCHPGLDHCYKLDPWDD